jgi:transposase, IS30 family
LNSREKTLTVNNGKEFAYHQAIDQALGIQTYFADPYCSWQLGSNENFNVLVRHSFPKSGWDSSTNSQPSSPKTACLQHL